MLSHRPSAIDLLNAWERGLSQASWQRALALLEAAQPAATRDAFPQLTIGERDALLLDLREALFGPDLEGVADCPACAERVEFSLQTSQLRDHTARETCVIVELNGYRVECRVPTSADLGALSGVQDSASARRALLDRCLVRAEDQGAPISSEALPSALIDAINDRLAKADPNGVVEFALCCPHCEHPWNAPFDIASYLWDEVQHWAKRTLREIHALASAYGWTEHEILRLSPHRRRLYLDLIQA